jgi:hypothetical protein
LHSSEPFSGSTLPFAARADGENLAALWRAVSSTVCDGALPERPIWVVCEICGDAGRGPNQRQYGVSGRFNHEKAKTARCFDLLRFPRGVHV